MSRNSNYQGFKNCETWLISMHISNEKGSYKFWNAVAKNCLKNERTIKPAVLALATELDESFTGDDNYSSLTGVWGDLMSTALANVDWQEVAESIIDGLD